MNNNYYHIAVMAVTGTNQSSARVHYFLSQITCNGPFAQLFVWIRGGKTAQFYRMNQQILKQFMEEFLLLYAYEKGVIRLPFDPAT